MLEHQRDNLEKRAKGLIQEVTIKEEEWQRQSKQLEEIQAKTLHNETLHIQNLRNENETLRR